MDTTTTGIERRTFLAASAIAGTAALSGSAAAAVSRTPIRVGTAVGRGWVIGNLEADHAGAVVVTLTAPDGGSIRVLITKSEPTGSPMAATEAVHLQLLNAGSGALPTPDDHVAVVQRLAHRLQGVEAKLPGTLMTSTERQRRFRPIDHKR